MLIFSGTEKDGGKERPCLVFGLELFGEGWIIYFLNDVGRAVPQEEDSYHVVIRVCPGA